MYAGIAFLIVFGMMWYHSSSLFITVLAFIQIIAALGCAYTAFDSIFRMPFFPFLNLVAIFIVIGIGADDVFVYMDHWRASDVTPQLIPFRPEGDPWKWELVERDEWAARRITWVLHHGGGAMFVTSLTTSAAFFANMVMNGGLR